jgi:uncharacterized RDD family membrane protein YckC
MDNQTVLDDSFTQNDNSKLPAANAGLRFLNYLIDTIVLYLVFFAGTIMLLSTRVISDSFLDSTMFSFSGIIVFFFYYLIFETVSNGRTIGKYITRTRVIKENGDKPRLKDYFIRSVSRFIPFEQFSAFSKNAHMWHDGFASTRVIKVNG